MNFLGNDEKIRVLNTRVTDKDLFGNPTRHKPDGGIKVKEFSSWSPVHRPRVMPLGLLV